MNITNLIIFLGMTMLVIADSVDCRARTSTGTECLASIEAGAFGQCPGGYYKVQGGYCERSCTPDEQKDCDADGCRSYSNACRPEQPISCQLAVNYCKGVVSDYICSNAPDYVRCNVNNVCQPFGAICCPPDEELENYLEQFHNIFEHADDPLETLQVITCGTNNADTSRALAKAYEAAGGDEYTGDYSSSCEGTTSYHVFYNQSISKPDDMEAITQKSQKICQSHGGIFSVTNED